MRIIKYLGIVVQFVNTIVLNTVSRYPQEIHFYPLFLPSTLSYLFGFIWIFCFILFKVLFFKFPLH